MIDANSVDKSSIKFVRNYLKDMNREKDPSKRCELLCHYLKLFQGTLIDPRAFDISTVNLDLDDSDSNEEISGRNANANPDSRTNDATSSRRQTNSKEKDARTNKTHILSGGIRHYKQSKNSIECKLCSKDRSRGSNNAKNHNPSTSRSSTNINKRKRSVYSSIPAPREAKVRATNSNMESDGAPSQTLNLLDTIPLTTRIFTKFYEDQVGDKKSENAERIQKKKHLIIQKLDQINKCHDVDKNWKIISALMGSFLDDSIEVNNYVPRTHYLDEPDTEVYKNINYFINAAHSEDIKFFKDQGQSP